MTPQLAMRRKNLEGLREQPLPEGYALRSYREGDAKAWCAIMNESIGSGWTHVRFRKEMLDPPQSDPAGLFFVTCGDIPIATACAWRDSVEERTIGRVHMLGALKAHRGKKLGRILTLRVLCYLKEHGFRSAELTTDDFRLSAIRIYLDFGFEPKLIHESHRARWAEVVAELGIPAMPEGFRNGLSERGT